MIVTRFLTGCLPAAVQHLPGRGEGRGGVHVRAPVLLAVSAPGDHWQCAQVVTCRQCCVLQWLETRPNRQICPVCKAGISRDKVIPLYGRGGDNKDPR